MEKKINIAELLKDCPKGMELDCAMFDGVTLSIVDVRSSYPIVIAWQEGEDRYTAEFTEYGCWNHNPNAKCVIFPKGKTTWEGFQRPFKDGDVLSYQFSGFENRSIYIYMYHPRMNTTYYVAVSGNTDSEFMINDQEGHALNSYNDTVRFATEEEKQTLFDIIKENGYKWNADTKTLEKLVEPKFKVGDKIKKKGLDNVYAIEITGVTQTVYTFKSGFQYIEATDKNYELVPNKFDITTLKPFDKVLVRDNDDQLWTADIFSFKSNNIYPFSCVGHYVNQCIPYEENKHLLGTTDDCDDYYNTWE